MFKSEVNVDTEISLEWSQAQKKRKVKRSSI